MGSSKKHKTDREHKRKHKHRSRSRSRSGSRERKTRREERKRRREEEEGEQTYGEAKVKKEDSEGEGPSKDGGESLSIQETNKIRARLGLKPLEVEAGLKEEPETGELTTADGDVHKPAVNISDLKKSQEFKEKLAAIKEKRRINKKLGKVKTLGDTSSEEDSDSALAWIKKSRKLQKQKEKAAKQAKMLEELDNDFGVDDLVSKEFKAKAPQYKSRDLAGLTVEHGTESFKEGRTVILTLKDQGVLEDGDETLVNVNMVDDERYTKNVENKKNQPDYKPYDDEDQYGSLKMPKVLGKYDEEIEGEKKKKFLLTSGGDYDASEEARLDAIRRKLQQQSQTLETAPLSIAREFYTPEEMNTKFKRVKRKVRKTRKSVKADDLVPMGEEAAADHGSRSSRNPRHDDSNNPVFSTDILNFEKPEEKEESKMPLEDDVELELQLALNKSRKLRQTKDRGNPEKIAEQVRQRAQEAVDMDLESDSDREDENAAVAMETGGDDRMILNATSEFCRTLGDIPTYGLAGNRTEERDELLDVELELLQERKRREMEEEEKSGWEAVEIDAQPVEIKPGDDPGTGLEVEPCVSTGVVAALSLATKKGFLEGDGMKASVSKPTALLASENYSILDKRLEDDDKYKRRERYSGGGGGMLSDFRDKNNYKPEINIEYADEHGRILGPKEAFKQLSYRFHGKGSGKKKTEKRMKKISEENETGNDPEICESSSNRRSTETLPAEGTNYHSESKVQVRTRLPFRKQSESSIGKRKRSCRNLMRQMSSTDTPLSTVSLFREKQRNEKTPYILLSGGQKVTSLTK